MLRADDLKLIGRIVKSVAAEELMTRFQVVHARTKTDGSLITEADIATQHRLQEDLRAHWPEFGLLGEEMSETQQERLLASPGRGLWCLDPLDGTSNFASGIPYFAVSLALIADGGVQAAVVYDPTRDECFSAMRGQGAWLNGQPLLAPKLTHELKETIAMVDLKRLPEPLVRAMAGHPPFRSQRSFGSVALDWCWIACGRCQVYLHGGQKLWDYAAGQLVLNESGAAGGVLDDYSGDWLTHLSLAPRIALAASNAGLLAQWRRWIAAGVGSD